MQTNNFLRTPQELPSYGDLYNDFFFNFREPSKYEKTHGGKFCGYLWIIQCGGWGVGVSISQEGGVVVGGGGAAEVGGR